MSRTPGRLSYANLTSTLALVIALSAGGAYAANSVKSKDIVDGQVKGVDLHKNSVRSPTIKDRSVTAADLAAGAVGSSAIQDGSVRVEHLSAAAVTSASVEDGTLRSTDIGTGAVGSFNIGDGQVMGIDLGPNSVTSVKLQDGQVQNSDLGSNVVNSVKVQDNTLTLADLLGGDVTLNVTVTGLAASRCSQVAAAVSGAVPGQIAFVTSTSTSAIPVGWSISPIRVLDNSVTLNLCNLTGAAATLTALPVRVVTLG